MTWLDGPSRLYSHTQLSQAKWVSLFVEKEQIFGPIIVAEDTEINGERGKKIGEIVEKGFGGCGGRVGFSVFFVVRES